MTRREVPEWIGATPDTPIPKRVKLRIWERECGRCYLSSRKIMPGDAYEFEHVIAIANGGENRESNIRLALSSKHKEKTARDVAEKAHIDRIRAKHLGLHPKGRGWNRGLRKKMDGTVVRR